LITAWRLTTPEFAQSAEQMLSGEGARLIGGRWNSPGTAVVYLGDSLALAAMELLVHLQPAAVPDAYRKMPVYLREEWVMHIDSAHLPVGWDVPTLRPLTRSIGDRWQASRESAVLQVPSAVVPGESNYLLNSEHPDAADIRVGPIEPFRYDSRLVKT